MNERVFLKAQLSLPTPPDHLQAKIMTSIERSMLRRLWTEIALACTATITLSSYVVLSWSRMRLEVHASSFPQFSRLVLSDPDVVVSHLHEMGWGIAESVPFGAVLLGLVLLLCVSCAIGLSLRLREVRQQSAIRVA